MATPGYQNITLATSWNQVVIFYDLFKDRNIDLCSFCFKDWALKQERGLITLDSDQLAAVRRHLPQMQRDLMEVSLVTIASDIYVTL